MNSTQINDAYINYKSEITRYLSHIVKQPQDAEDLAQDCFIRLMNVTVDIPEDRILYYLKRIARNLAMDSFRRRTRTLRRDSRLEVPTHHVDTSNLEISEGVHDLVSHINNTEHRKILELRLIHGYSIKETAELVNRSEGMIKSSVFHAVNQFGPKSSHKRWLFICVKSICTQNWMDYDGTEIPMDMSKDPILQISS